MAVKYSQVPNKLVSAANGVDYAYREADLPVFVANGDSDPGLDGDMQGRTCAPCAQARSSRTRGMTCVP